MASENTLSPYAEIFGVLPRYFRIGMARPFLAFFLNRARRASSRNMGFLLRLGPDNGVMGRFADIEGRNLNGTPERGRMQSYSTLLGGEP